MSKKFEEWWSQVSDNEDIVETVGEELAEMSFENGYSIGFEDALRQTQCREATQDIKEDYQEKIDNLQEELKEHVRICVEKERTTLKLDEQLEEANKIIDMIENNNKMPHKHKDYYERLCCLSERAREYKEKWSKE